MTVFSPFLALIGLTRWLPDQDISGLSYFPSAQPQWLRHFVHVFVQWQCQKRENAAPTADSDVGYGAARAGAAETERGRTHVGRTVRQRTQGQVAGIYSKTGGIAGREGGADESSTWPRATGKAGGGIHQQDTAHSKAQQVGMHTVTQTQTDTGATPAHRGEGQRDDR